MIYILEVCRGQVEGTKITFEVKINIHVLAKPGGIVIAICFSIAKSFQDVIRL